MNDKLSEDTYQKAVTFIKKYWNEDDAIGDNNDKQYFSSDFIEPKTDNTTNQFSFGLGNTDNKNNNNQMNKNNNAHNNVFSFNNRNNNDHQMTFQF